MPRGDQGFQVVIDPLAWYQLKKDLDSFDPSLAKALRKRIRNAGMVAADAVKSSLSKPSPAGGSSPMSSEVRAQLIAATRISVSFGKKAAGAKIVTGSNRLSAENKGLLKAYNKKHFRHPLFGDKTRWVVQEGRPYFGSVIQQALDRALVNEIQAALRDATATIKVKGTL
ncbi:hypothetical protein E3T54_02940 [Cryobacterium sp. Sr8]|uniref:hypothetical protein n=1 Tax=Cryobacterium sp. Sr8 TaxID=1259203 RepID=UPI001069F8C6|nr:hypothetical protein [Cryobacterium sp. Sr8]TFD80713.1 hypothetical protein E3T54_02940 [Cryobacterium sp. Sr8]